MKSVYVLSDIFVLPDFPQPGFTAEMLQPSEHSVASSGLPTAGLCPSYVGLPEDGGRSSFDAAQDPSYSSKMTSEELEFYSKLF